MARSLPEWIGKTDDTPVPVHVKVRVFERFHGYCQGPCNRKIMPGWRWVCDHRTALINGGQNREANLQPICDWCDKKVKTPADVAEKSRTYHKRKSHLGLKSSKRPMPGSRKSKWKRKIDGTVVRRDK